MAVSPTTIYEDVFDAIKTILKDNKPTYVRTVAGVDTTFTYDILAAYHRGDASFPQLVLNKAMIQPMLLNLDRTGEDYEIEIQMDLYAKELHGKKALDEALSQLMALFIANFSSLESDNGLIPNKDDWWEVSNNSTFEDNNQVLNTVSAVLRFKLK